MVTETERSTDPAILCWSVGRSRTTATWAAMKDQSWQDFIEWLDPGNPAATKEVTPYVGGTLDYDAYDAGMSPVEAALEALEYNGYNVEGE